MLNRKIVEAIANQTTPVVNGRDEDTSFECPKCLGSHFGRGYLDEDIFHCHDEWGQGCKWSGPENKCFTTYSKETLAEELIKLYNQLGIK